MYTLQAQYLAYHPLELPPAIACAILLLGLSGYAIFRAANHQKDMVRRLDGNCKIWGKKARLIRAKYATTDGKMHTSILLLSGKYLQIQCLFRVANVAKGWWGISRHANYVGDLILSFSMCAACGIDHILPWTYAVYMLLILVHRCYRDENRCRAKYGAQWIEYCKLVPYRFIPGIW